MIFVYALVLLILLVILIAILIRRYGPRSSRVLKSSIDYTIHGNERTMGEFNIHGKIYMMKDQILDDFYDLIKYSDQILTKHSIPYTAAYGTLLGAIRHGGIMPWDDDADLYIHVPIEKYDEIILPLKEELEKDGYVLRKNHDAEYFHMCKAGASNNFPYIDWYQYKGTYSEEKLLPIKRVPYEDFEICVPNKTVECIDIHYNKDGRSAPLENIVCPYPFRRYYSLWVAQFLKRYPKLHKALDRASKIFVEV